MAWGYNDNGELGDRTVTNKNAPVEMSGLTNEVSIAAGSEQSFALLPDGTVMACGTNDFGQVGAVIELPQVGGLHHRYQRRAA